MTDKLTDYELNIVSSVETEGCFVTGVFDPDGDDPNFAYSVGFPSSLRMPEVFMSGLDVNLMASLINLLHSLAANGLELRDGLVTDQLLNGYDCVLRRVHPSFLDTEFFNSAIWYAEKFGPQPLTEALQIVWPDLDGYFPWDDGAPAEFKAAQHNLYDGELPS